jgi:hypothetical protein
MTTDGAPTSPIVEITGCAHVRVLMVLASYFEKKNCCLKILAFLILGERDIVKLTMTVRVTLTEDITDASTTFFDFFPMIGGKGRRRDA